MEAIKGIGAKFYSILQGVSPLRKKLFGDIAEDICKYITSGIILDVGTGPGNLPFEIAKRSKLEIVGIDLSESMITIARKNKQKICPGANIRFEVADSVKLPFADESFDLVVSTMSMHHWSKPQLGVSEIGRVLKKTGTALIYDIWSDISKERSAEVRKKYGFFPWLVLIQIVRRHSSTTRNRAQEIIASSHYPFASVAIEEFDFLLKIRVAPAY
jgi:ubiquinone/menaquinone biosynthesis C-methylase UbiE